MQPTMAPLRIGHGARPLASESHWLLSTAGKWTEEDEREWKRQQHRENMVFFRRKKKEQQAELRTEHQQLEQRLQQHLAMQRRAASRASQSQRYVTSRDKQHAAVCHLIAETEALKIENVALQDQINKHKTLQENAGDGLESDITETTSSVASRDDSSSDSSVSGGSLSAGSSSSSSSLSQLISLQRGWRVNFSGGEPSFHFHPFAKEQLDAIREGYDAKFAVLPPLNHVGDMLGWEVERAPLIQHPTLKVLVTRVRYTKRIHCAGGSAHATMDKLDADSWPVLTTPELWRRIHNGSVTSQVLQAVDEDTFVLVRNAPERSLGVTIRYLNLVSRRRVQYPGGRRSITYAMVVVTSAANQRSREAEPECLDVHWINEGGAYMTLSQIDHDTLEVVYDHCSGCMSEQHAQHCLVDWGHIVIRWEQLVTPSRVLTF
ncbi:malate dehydrogenase [Phytophthora cinnamomi]|uniref:malate dehydrogenase n=1 Tax=Phytophthora cinnamomi TaxID=4785 RepID=UPI00355A37A7|nr:malate dehydrogenase [Phytophthora cinnamomi]